MKILLIALLVVGIIVPIYADSYESVDSKNYLFLEIDDGLVHGLLQLEDGRIISINDEIKMYKNNGFKIKSLNDKISLYGSFDKLRVLVFDFNDRQRVFIEIQELSTERLEPKEQQWVGMPHIETLQKIEAEKIQAEKEKERLDEIQYRLNTGNYTVSDNEIKIILDNNSKRIPYYDGFDFKLRVVDPEINKYHSYWVDKGYVDDAVIHAIVKDPYGKIIKQYNGNTTDKGTFSSDGIISFTSNSFVKNAYYTLEVIATKYFNVDATFATSLALKEFVIYRPLNDNTKYDVYPPVGTLEIEKSVGGIANTLKPKLNLTCHNYDRENNLIVGGCKYMSFAINGTDFTESIKYDFSETFEYPEKLEDGTFNTIYVQYTDDSNRANVSIEDIFDTVIIDLGYEK